MTARRWLVGPPRLAVVVAVVVAAIASGLTPSISVGGVRPAGVVGAGLLLVALVVGTPHGASDVARLGRTPRQFVTGATLYALCALTVGLVWFLAPLWTVLALLVVSAVHFGVGDLDVTTCLGGAVDLGRVERTVRVVAMGGIPVTVPLGLHGGAVTDILDHLTAGRGAVVVLVCRALLPIVAAAAVWTVALTPDARGDVVIDVLALSTLFVVLSPLYAFAVYFGFWHAWRQTGLMVDTMVRRRSGKRPRWARLAIASSAASIAALAAAAALAIVRPGSGVVAAALVVVLCLTVPHAIVSSREKRAGRVSGRRVRHPCGTASVVRPFARSGSRGLRPAPARRC
ncbi:Brp/Blh family beta-carotene 15,15'-dioxygenase [uncultured Williamsia sp.]|uniref:Brp/Blh family beta-carotene 15,15'-dioxygenase n=1 Tax=uncultured Williamsia sp. TaxID=259311 RepID=UPI002633E0CA|nr:Brp/Blh family beta-carotene 15,15'-dioxygenase [uncultured Williamsia sp.]